MSRFAVCNWYMVDYVWIMFTKGINEGKQLQYYSFNTMEKN